MPTWGILHVLSTLNSCCRKSVTAAYMTFPLHPHTGKGKQSYIKRATGLQDHNFLVPRGRAQAEPLVCLLTEIQKSRHTAALSGPSVPLSMKKIKREHSKAPFSSCWHIFPYGAGERKGKEQSDKASVKSSQGGVLQTPAEVTLFIS